MGWVAPCGRPFSDRRKRIAAYARSNVDTVGERKHAAHFARECAEYDGRISHSPTVSNVGMTQVVHLTTDITRVRLSQLHGSQ